MGPLVPEIISPEMSLLVAVVLGFGFGFALEQAGFSTTRKLVGLFYGYDFTVLRVFFTAGVTAMVGVLVLGHLGLLDLNLIYVNPLFTRSAIVGGLIMGAGFITGGFCPGTSVCAAATGKADALFFIGGSILGIIAFAEFYPSLEPFLLADNHGPLRIDAALGLSPVVFAALLTFVALAAFFITTLIENKVNRVPAPLSRQWKTRFAVAAALPLAIIGLVAVTPSQREIVLASIEEAQQQNKCIFREIDGDKLAYDLTHHQFELNLIDVRTPAEFKKSHLPLAINIPLNQVLNRDWEQIFRQKIRRNIFYADDHITPRKACLLAKHVGKSENYILSDTRDEFNKKFFKLATLGPDASKTDLQIYAFRSSAARIMKKLALTMLEMNRPPKKKVRKVIGGCS